jgi:ubiquitin-conjugating enzyme E2 D/E
MFVNTGSYENGCFPLNVEIPRDYPFKPPTLRFLCPIYHPNVSEEGALCLDLLKPDAWKPSTQLVDVFRCVRLLLAEPNPDDALVPSIAEQFRRDRDVFDATAREWTAKHAPKPSK